jgi:hypothetical protein
LGRRNPAGLRGESWANEVVKRAKVEKEKGESKLARGGILKKERKKERKERSRKKLGWLLGQKKGEIERGVWGEFQT